MTILELRAAYGTKVYITSAGDNLSLIVDKIYDSRDDVFYKVLQELNTRYDWDLIEPGSEILYIPKQACSEYSEYHSRW